MGFLDAAVDDTNSRCIGVGAVGATPGGGAALHHPLLRQAISSGSTTSKTYG